MNEMTYALKFCPQCGNEHTNPKFCSRSCSAVYTNARRSADSYRRGEGQCKDCGTTISKQRTRCRPCHSEWQSERVLSDSVTLEEAVLRYKNHHRSSAYALIRTRARVVMKKVGRYGVCEWCGYDKHTEVCHRKAISDHKPDDLLSEINNPNNLLALCPNCHWEHDKLDRRQ